MSEFRKRQHLSQGEVRRKTDWEWWDNLWEQCADQHEYLELVQAVDPEMTEAEWDYAWQWCVLNHESKSAARRQFVMAVAGTY